MRRLPPLFWLVFLALALACSQKKTTTSGPVVREGAEVEVGRLVEVGGDPASVDVIMPDGTVTVTAFRFADKTVAAIPLGSSGVFSGDAEIRRAGAHVRSVHVGASTQGDAPGTATLAWMDGVASLLDSLTADPAQRARWAKTTKDARFILARIRSGVVRAQSASVVVGKNSGAAVTLDTDALAALDGIVTAAGSGVVAFDGTTIAPESERIGVVSQASLGNTFVNALLVAAVVVEVVGEAALASLLGPVVLVTAGVVAVAALLATTASANESIPASASNVASDVSNDVTSAATETQRLTQGTDNADIGNLVASDANPNVQPPGSSGSSGSSGCMPKAPCGDGGLCCGTSLCCPQGTGCNIYTDPFGTPDGSTHYQCQ